MKPYYLKSLENIITWEGCENFVLGKFGKPYYLESLGNQNNLGSL
jgi:hypothetical protein